MSQSLYQMDYKKQSIASMHKSTKGKQLNTKIEGLKEYKAISYLSNRNQLSFSKETNGGIKDGYCQNRIIINGKKEDGNDNGRGSNGFLNEREFLGNKREYDDNISPKQEIVFKCYNCGKEGHLAKYCPLTLNTITPKCIICKKNTHDKNTCPNRKCFKCDKIGHLADECDRKALISKKVQCTRCKEYGHNEYDCLINPIKIRGNDNKIQCLFCNSKEHMICSIPKDAYTIKNYDSDCVIISDSDNDQKANKQGSIIQSSKEKVIIEHNPTPKDFCSIVSFFKQEIKKSNAIVNNHCNPNNSHHKKKIQLPPKRIFESIPNDEIKYTVFCEKCGGMHTSFTCGKPKPTNSFIQTRHHTFQVKNPLKFQPIKPRKEFIINHHLPYRNIYDDNNSSGDSFSEIVKDHLIKHPKNS